MKKSKFNIVFEEIMKYNSINEEYFKKDRLYDNLYINLYEVLEANKDKKQQLIDLINDQNIQNGFDLFNKILNNEKVLLSIGFSLTPSQLNKIKRNKKIQLNPEDEQDDTLQDLIIRDLLDTFNILPFLNGFEEYK